MKLTHPGCQSNQYSWDIGCRRRVLHIYRLGLQHLHYILVHCIVCPPPCATHLSVVPAAATLTFWMIASFAPAVCCTFMGFAYGRFFTIWMIASFAPAVCFTFIGCACGSYFTIWMIASFAPAVCYTFIGCACGSYFTIWMIASFAPAVCFTFIGCACGSYFTIWMIASFAPAVCCTFIGCAYGRCFTIWMIASFFPRRVLYIYRLCLWQLFYNLVHCIVFPPPCAIHLPVLSRADFLQSG